MRFVLRSFLVLQLLGVEVVLLGRVGSITPDLSAWLLAFCALELKPARVPYVLLPLAMGRTLLYPGGLAFHLWVLLVGYGMVLPLRRRLFPERWQLQMLVGAVIGAILSLAQGWLLSEQGHDPCGRGISSWLVTGITTPGALLLLSLLYRGIAMPRMRPETIELPT